MSDFSLTFAVHAAIILVFILLLKGLGKVKISLLWVLVSVALFASYFIAVFEGGSLIPINSTYPELNWNWSGKVAAILLWLTVLLILIKAPLNFKASDAGFTFKQNEDSFRPAIMGLMLFILLHVVVSFLLGEGPDYDAEELLFQATMPGLDEEPVFRGLLLYTLSLGFISERINILGAKINIAGLSLCVLFGLGHGIMYSNGEWNFALISVLITGLYGFILLWFRERTGSLVFPIVAHNSVNFIGQFF